MEKQTEAPSHCELPIPCASPKICPPTRRKKDITEYRNILTECPPPFAENLNFQKNSGKSPTPSNTPTVKPKGSKHHSPRILQPQMARLEGLLLTNKTKSTSPKKGATALCRNCRASRYLSSRISRLHTVWSEIINVWWRKLCGNEESGGNRVVLQVQV